MSTQEEKDKIQAQRRERQLRWTEEERKIVNEKRREKRKTFSKASPVDGRRETHFQSKEKWDFLQRLRRWWKSIRAKRSNAKRLS